MLFLIHNNDYKDTQNNEILCVLVCQDINGNTFTIFLRHQAQHCISYVPNFCTAVFKNYYLNAYLNCI